jgi:hypothetical protein
MLLTLVNTSGLALLRKTKFSTTSAHREQDYHKRLTCTAGCSVGASKDFHKLLTGIVGLSQLIYLYNRTLTLIHLYRRAIVNDSPVRQDSQNELSVSQDSHKQLP